MRSVWAGAIVVVAGGAAGSALPVSATALADSEAGEGRAYDQNLPGGGRRSDSVVAPVVVVPVVVERDEAVGNVQRPWT